MATTVFNPSRPFRGLRPLDPRRDLSQVADLIEHAFAGELDPTGQAALRELRLMGHLGGMVGWLSRASDWPQLFGGYVWIEDGRVVGNVTVQRADVHARRWQIANVAVDPAYRRHGIGRALMEAALEHIHLHGGTWAVLQVREDNEIARRLYERLGFEAITGTSELRRPAPPKNPPPMPSPLPMEPLPPQAWREIYDLAMAATPPLAQWWQPLRLHRFRITVDQRLGEWLNRLIARERVWRLGLRRDRQLIAALIVRGTRWRPPHRLEIWVHPTHWGTYEPALVALALQLLAGYPAWEIHIQAHTEHQQLIEALQAAGFEAYRTLVTMRRPMTPATETP
ncbi:MAG: GNAT family N-acetyltransferase [Chloroflexi bacterium]|nr:GNAT family N-acetyltransferase [Chloroflexota bacterium]